MQEKNCHTIGNMKHEYIYALLYLITTYTVR